MFQGLSLDSRYDTQDSNRRYEIIIPGSVIPEWFSHQSSGVEVNIKEPSSHLCDEWMGIAVCVVFCSLSQHQIYDTCLLSCEFIANGKLMSATPRTRTVVGLSDHIWLLYLLPRYYKEDDIKLLKECEANEFIQIGIKIETSVSSMEVKKCGFRMVYKKDMEDLNRAMAQNSNTSIIPYEDMGVHNDNLDNSTVAVEGNKAKRMRDDYDGAGPCGEGCSNDVPHPKRIERLADFMVHGDSDCEEFFECGEEHND